MPQITINITETQQEALNKGESITITTSTTNTVSKSEKDYSNLEYPYGNTFRITDCCISHNYKGLNTAIKKTGAYRKYLKNAERDLKLKTDLLRLGALVEAVQEELQDTWVADWDDACYEKYFIAYDETNKCFDYDYIYTHNIVGVLFMSKQVAQRVVEILNKQPEILKQ